MNTSKGNLLIYIMKYITLLANGTVWTKLFKWIPVQQQMCCEPAKKVMLLIPCPHAFIEYLPAGPMQGTEEINTQSSLSPSVSGDTNYYGECYSAG